MPPTLKTREYEFLDQAQHLPPAERAQLALRLCNGDPQCAAALEAVYQKDREMSDLFRGLSRGVAAVAHPRAAAPSGAGEDESPGEQIGRFRITGRLGQGGMGVVYRAFDPKHNRTVALKMLHPNLHVESGVRRFLREAEAASGLNHPNIAPIFEFSDDEPTYIVMPCYEGESLQQRIGRGPLPPADALAVALDVARGLACAHRHHIIHRDIKPANLFCTAEGHTVILDFGVAHLEGATITHSGAVIGTLAYMAPEQRRGERIDGRSDLYALGVVLHEMLTGLRPPAAATHSLPGELPPPAPRLPPDLPPGLMDVVHTLLRPNRDERYPSADAVIAALEAVRQGTRPVRVRRRGVQLALAGALALAAVALGVLGVRSFWYPPLPGEWRVVVLPVEADVGLPLSAEGTRLAIASAARFVARYTDGKMQVLLPGETASVLSGPDARRRFGATLALRVQAVRQGTDMRLRLALLNASDGRRLRTSGTRIPVPYVTAIEGAAASAVAELFGLSPPSVPNAGGTRSAAAYQSYLRANSLMEHADNPENLLAAEQELRQGLALDAGYGNAMALLCLVYATRVREGEDPSPAVEAEAERTCGAAVRQAPNLAVTQYAYGTYLKGMARRQEALASFERAVLLDPLFSDAWRGKADVAASLGQQTVAGEAYVRAMKLAPDRWADRYAYGNFLLLTGRPAQALEQFDAVARMRPDSPFGPAGAGSALMQMGKPDEALRRLRASMSIQPNAVAAGLLGYYYQTTGKPVEAERIYATALTLDSLDKDLWINLAGLRDELKRPPGEIRQAWRGALSAIERERRRRPENTALMLDEALCRAKLGMPGALPLIEKGLAGRASPDAYLLAASVLLELGERLRARTAVQHALALGAKPEYIDTYYPDLAPFTGSPQTTP